MTLTPFQAYSTFINLRNHFKIPSYDYIKYQGKSRLNEHSFNVRTDQIFFQKVAKHKDGFNFMLANLVENPKIYIRSLAYDNESERIYNEWLKKQESLTYLFEQDVHKIDSIRQSVKIPKNQHPQLFQMYLQNKIMLETIALILDVTQILPLWNKRLGLDPVWQMEGQKIRKYIPFLPKEKSKFKKIIVAKLRQK